MKMTTTIVCPLLLIFLSACNNSISTSNDAKINQKISILESEISKLQNSLDTIKDKDLLELRADILKINLKTASTKVAIFTPSDKDFQTINTDSGIFLVSLKNIEEYADGYKITFSIGNPSTATYSNIHITLLYGPKSKEANGIDLMHSTKYETDTNQNIMPGYWTDVEIILSNIKKEQLNEIWVQILPKILKLHLPPPKIRECHLNCVNSRSF